MMCIYVLLILECLFLFLIAMFTETLEPNARNAAEEYRHRIGYGELENWCFIWPVLHAIPADDNCRPANNLPS